jgi:cellulose synthase/poly-beta-1,6-N-acetylglucosamine synthase-like glycosyltransferase
VAPFDDPTVGMTGGRPVPVNDSKTWMGRVVHVLWDLHHALALERPKLGELVAFRPLFASLSSTAVDEAAIESIVRSRGLRLVYVPSARVRMKGPCTVSEFLAQRRRIYAGHLHLSRMRGYRVSTMSSSRLVATAWRAGPRGMTGRTTLAGAAALEATARVLGAWDERIVGRRHEVWERLQSTKDLSP